MITTGACDDQKFPPQAHRQVGVLEVEFPRQSSGSPVVNTHLWLFNEWLAKQQITGDDVAILGNGAPKNQSNRLLADENQNAAT